MKNTLLFALIVALCAFAWVHPETNKQIRSAFLQAAQFAKGKEIAANQQVGTQNDGSREKSVVTLTADGNNQFHVRAMVNGSVTDFLVDTGATFVYISREEARRVGIDLDSLNYNQRAQTADGIVKFAEVNLDEISIGGITVKNVRTGISQSDYIGTNLLGMSFFSQLDGVQFSGNRMILQN